MVKGVERFEADGPVLSDGTKLPVDAVILATGYHSKILDFADLPEQYFNAIGHPAQLWYDGHPGLYFLGFAAPSTGIIRSIIQDSEKIVAHLQANAKSHNSQTA